MVYLLMQGEEYKPYSFSDKYKIERAQEWKKDNYFDFSHIYKGFGNPVGFISLESGLFDATSLKHKKMWVEAVKNNKEERSFVEFEEQLRTDLNFLISSFENAVREKDSGVFNTQPYLIVFEEKRLKTGKYYIYLENTSRRM
jgi:hypothetical protein